MKNVAALSIAATLALCSAQAATREGVDTRIEPVAGARLARSLTSTDQPPSVRPADAAAPSGPRAGTILWTVLEQFATIDREGVAISGDGTSVMGGWWLNNMYVGHYQTTGNGTPVWTHPMANATFFVPVDLGTGNSVIAATAGGEPLLQFGPGSGTPTYTHTYPGTFTGSHVAVHPTGSFIVGASVDQTTPNPGRVQVYSATTGGLNWEDTTLVSGTQGVDISSDGSRMAGNEYATMNVWNTATGPGSKVSFAISGTQTIARLSSNGDYLVFGDFSGHVLCYQWNGSAYTQKWSFTTGDTWTTAVDISDDASTVMAGTWVNATPYTGAVYMIDVATGGQVWKDGTFGDYVQSVALSADGARGVASSWGGYNRTQGNIVSVYDRASNVPAFAIADDSITNVGSAFAAAISDNGRYVAVGGKAVHARTSGYGGWLIAIDMNQSCSTITLSPATLPAATVGTAYSQTITASGGVAPYTYAVTSGALPAGLALTGGGVLSGTPTASGTFNFTVTATDANNCTGSQAYSLLVNPPGCGTIVLSPAALPGGWVGMAYSQTVTASGGVGGYTYAVTAGSLPAGLTLSTGGVIAGTPTASGTSSFTITATDANNCTGSRAYTIIVGVLVDYVVGDPLVQPAPNRVRVYTGAGVATGTNFSAYGAGQWGVVVASGDLDLGNYAEILTGPGPGPVYGPQVRAFKRDGTPMGKVNFYAYGTLKYGVNVTSGDIDGDPFDEILTAAGPGAVFGPHVRGWNYDGTTLAPIAKVSFFAYSTLRFGVNVSTGDLDSDGFHEILTGAGPSPVFASTIRAFNYDGSMVTSIGKINFNAFSYTGYGVNVAGGDVDGDAFAEIVASPGPGPTHPARFAGFNFDNTAVNPLAGYDITPYTTVKGGRIGTGDVNDDGREDLLCGAGPDATADSTVKAYDYAGAALTQIAGQFAPWGTNLYGVNVEAGALGY